MRSGDLRPEAWAAHRAEARREVAEVTRYVLTPWEHGRRPQRIGGDLALKAREIAIIGVIASAATWVYGPRLFSVLLAREVQSHIVLAMVAAVCGRVTAVIMAAVYCGLVWWLLALKRGSANCLSAEQIAGRVGTAPATVEQALTDARVAPAYIVDGLPVYRPSDADDALHLLRPSSPRAAERLVRPTGAGQPDAERLARPAGSGGRSVDGGE